MCRFSPFGRTKGHPEGNCDVIISHEIQKVNKVANIDEPRDFFDIEFVRPITDDKVSDSIGYVSDSVGYINEQEEKVLNFLKTNNTLTSKDVEELLHVTEARARRFLKQMCEKNLLIKLGSARSTHYKLSKAVGDE